MGETLPYDVDRSWRKSTGQTTNTKKDREYDERQTEYQRRLHEKQEADRRAAEARRIAADDARRIAREEAERVARRGPLPPQHQVLSGSRIPQRPETTPGLSLSDGKAETATRVTWATRRTARRHISPTHRK